MEPFYFSSRKFGSGVNVPDPSEAAIKFSDIALNLNSGEAAV